MKGLETILIVGALGIGAWCFMMGPCKDMLGDRLNLTGAIVRPTRAGKAVPRCGPGEITTEEGCAKARSANYGAGWYY